jgi:hypothetical protein
MDMRKFSGTSYVKLDDVEAGPIQATIVAIKVGNFGKPDLTLDSGRKFSVNTGNNQILVKAFGDNSDDWLGQEIELFLGTTKYQGKDQDSVVVRPLTSGRPAAERTPLPASDEIDDEVPF